MDYLSMTSPLVNNTFTTDVKCDLHEIFNSNLVKNEVLLVQSTRNICWSSLIQVNCNIPSSQYWSVFIVLYRIFLISRSIKCSKKYISYLLTMSTCMAFNQTSNSTFVKILQKSKTFLVSSFVKSFSWNSLEKEENRMNIIRLILLISDSANFLFHYVHDSYVFSFRFSRKRGQLFSCADKKGKFGIHSILKHASSIKRAYAWQNK